MTATVADGDFEMLSMNLTFASGSGDGALMCSSIVVLSDIKAEGDESFSIKLNLLTAGSSIGLGNHETAVILTDDDGMLISNLPLPKILPNVIFVSCIICTAIRDKCC